MRVLITTDYSRSLSESLIRSLINSRLVDRVYVVSDVDLSSINGAQLYITPKWVRSPFEGQADSGNRITFRGILRLLTHFFFIFYIAVRKNPDIIIGFHIFPQSTYAFICAKLFRKPVVACLGDWPGIWRIRRVLLPMLKRCDIVTTTGSKTREYLIREGINPEIIYARPDPTDTDKYKPFILPKLFDVLYVGRLATEKNVSTLIRVVDQVRKTKEDLKVGIVGECYLKESLEQLSKQLGLTDCVEFLGWQENTEYYYNRSKILVLTSLHEGLPRVMIEAMACGVPCIVSNVGDITDAAIDGFNALVIQDPNDIQSYTNAIIELLNNNDLYKKLSQNTRMLAEENYSLNSATEAWDKILNILD